MTEEIKYTTCPYCHKEVQDTPRSIGSHIGYWHKGISKSIYNRNRTFDLECKECGKKVANTNNVLSRHVRKAHGLEWPVYHVKHDMDGIWPTCGCGCGEALEWRKGGFLTYVNGHENRPTPEPEIIDGSIAEPISDQKPVTEDHGKQVDTDLPIDLPIIPTHEPQPVRSEPPLEPEVTIQEGFHPQWMPHPLQPQKDIYVRSLLEKRFLDEKSDERIFVTNQHEIRVTYIDENGDEHAFNPGYLVQKEMTVYGFGIDDTRRQEAAARWCKENGMRFKVVRYDAQGKQVTDPYMQPTILEKNTTSTKMS